MNREELRELIRIVEESDIDELEIRRWGRTVRIAKNSKGRAMAERSEVLEAAPPPAARAPVVAPPAAAPEPEPESAEALHEVRSPMVGTFYRAPSPEAPPFVELGDTVRVGQTLCILEAMKLMNELQAEVGGVIRRIRVENAQPVEYGQVLFEIQTS